MGRGRQNVRPEYYDDRKEAEDYGSGYNMQELDVHSRPREKAENAPESVKALSNSELVAILIRTGTQKANAVDLATHLLQDHNGKLLDLYRSLINGTLYNLKGIGKVKKVTILAALELGLRLKEEMAGSETEERVAFNTSSKAYHYMQQRLLGVMEEQMWVLILSSQCTLIKPFLISKGGISETTADIRTILRHVIRFSGSGFILMHNHPGGSLTPSRGDDDLTRTLIEASKTVCVTFLDHIIFTDRGYYSYRDSSHLF